MRHIAHQVRWLPRGPLGCGLFIYVSSQQRPGRTFLAAAGHFLFSFLAFLVSDIPAGPVTQV
jgi:hypothetical protein